MFRLRWSKLVYSCGLLKWNPCVHRISRPLYCPSTYTHFLGLPLHTGQYLWLFTNYACQCQGQGRDNQGQAGTSWDKAGTNRDKQTQTGTVLFCPCLSLLVPVCPCPSLYVQVCPLPVPACPCLSLSVPVCPCLPLFVHVCLYILFTCISPPADEYHSLHQMKIVTLNLLVKATVPMHTNLILTSLIFFFYFYFSRTLSFNLNSSTWFLEEEKKFLSV